MFPKIEADLEKLREVLDTEDAEITPLGKTFRFDYKVGQHIIVDGKMVECSEDEAVAQWIEKVLRTELNKYGIYTDEETEDFGISIYNYIGQKNLHEGYIVSELKREITEQLLKHRYIERVENFEATKTGRRLDVSFDVALITGTYLTKEVQINGI